MSHQSISPCQRLSPAARSLLALLAQPGESDVAERMPPLPAQAWDEMLDLARRHGVTPLLHRALQARGTMPQAPESARTRLEEDRRAAALDNLRRYGEFRRIARALREARIPVMALKGLHLAELVYRDISLRPMSDMDILVPRTQLRRAVATLHSLEYGFEQDVSGAAPGMLGTKCNIGLAHRRLGVWLEIHWTLAEPGACYAPPMEDIWRAAVSVRLGDAETQVMSPDFLLLHVCAHLACNHVFGFNLRGLYDIAQIVRAHPELDWRALTDLGQRHGWTRGIAAALRLARDHLGAGIPDPVLSALGGDALDPAMLVEAIDHLLAFSGMPDELVTAPNLLAAAAGGSLWSTGAILWKRIFVPRAELALLYGVPEHSLRLGLYYVLRLRDLVRKYAASAWALKVSDPALAAMAARHARLAKWIAGG